MGVVQIRIQRSTPIIASLILPLDFRTVDHQSVNHQMETDHEVKLKLRSN